MWPPSEVLQGVTDHQKQAVADATARGRIGILTGGPGTGKTHVMNALMHACEADWELTHAFDDPQKLQDRIRNGEPVCRLCAPTGKAAVRMTEMTGRVATTIHQLLEIGRIGYDGEGWDFQRNSSNPLQCEYLFVDEAPMIDTKLMNQLLSAVGTADHAMNPDYCVPNTRLLLMGDPNQLRPVSTGQPFFDMLESGRIPVGTLSEVHRNSGAIGQVCEAIRQRRPWIPDAESSFTHIEAQTSEEILQAVWSVITQQTPAMFGRWLEDVQVICPLNTKGGIGRNVLNGFLGEQFKAVDPTMHKLVFTRNCLLKSGTQTHPSPVGHYFGNGQVVVVKEAVFPQHSSKKEAFAIQRTGHMLNPLFPKRTIRDVTEPGYAITCHKAQGSEWPVVIVIADPSSSAARICDSSWWLTAISRAVDHCYVIGPKRAVVHHCKRTFGQRRKTFLKEQIWHWVKEPELVGEFR